MKKPEFATTAGNLISELTPSKNALESDDYRISIDDAVAFKGSVTHPNSGLAGRLRSFHRIVQNRRDLVSTGTHLIGRES